MKGLWIILAAVIACLGIPASSASEPNTADQLRKVAITFNNNYSKNSIGPVYDRWDTQSQKIITRNEYIHRHQLCATNPGAAIIGLISKIGNQYWQVHYSIDQANLIDYWSYINGAWRFSLYKSNPDAVALYKLSLSEYERKVGCKT